MDTQMQQMMILFTRRAAPALMARQLQAFRTMLVAVIQEALMLRALLLRSAVIDRDALCESLKQILSRGHDGAGALPWQRHAGYPFRSKETERPRLLGGTNEDIAALQTRCEFLSALS